MGERFGVASELRKSFWNRTAIVPPPPPGFPQRMKFYAHTKSAPDGSLLPLEEWEPLFSEDCPALSGNPCDACERMESDHGHLNKVAWWTAKFAAEMFPEGPNREAAREWGRIAGLWHDLGKFSKAWQRYLRTKADTHSDEVAGKVDHATAGAIHAARTVPVVGHVLAFAIAGHHSGLLDAVSPHACMDKRLAKPCAEHSGAPESVVHQAAPTLPPFFSGNLNAHSLATYTRLLFSCLVDADFLATEAFMAPDRKRLRPENSDKNLLPRMLELLEARIDAFGPPQTPVDRSRAEVHRHCCAAAALAPGLFSLNVPTGGGKTLSSLAFALRHAIAHGLRRVIYVIPFTSIIEQNASVFDGIFAPLIAATDSPVVVEHHSNLSPDNETERSRLAAENWDAPLVVTTAVQFYESLHAARTSSCRKLHRIANSVVILDEAQCLPVDYLRPCLAILDRLSRQYRTSVVLCTATQPAIHKREKFPIGLENIRPIIPDADALASSLERVRVIDRDWLPDGRIAEEMATAPQVLAIVNTRRHAQALFQLLPTSSENFHLSALMCPAHRRIVLDAICERLEAGLPTRLVSTQLVEAGVDIDFPLVYRSLAGLDSIAQAAGRCNRNGRLGIGETHVFRSEHTSAETFFRDTAQVAYQVLSLHDNPLSLAAVEQYFHLYYLNHNPPDAPRWDTKDIAGDFQLDHGSRTLPMLFQFKATAGKFHLIETVQTPILIPYDDLARRLVAELRNESIPLHRGLLRSLQRYTVQMRPHHFHANRAQFESLRDDQFHALICPETHYSEQFGLDLDSDNDTPLIC